MQEKTTTASQPVVASFVNGFVKHGRYLGCVKCGSLITATEIPHQCKFWRAR